VTGTDSPPSGEFTAAHWDGTTWDATTTLDLPGPSFESYNAVATSTGEVWSAGTYQNGPLTIAGHAFYGFAAHYDGSHWSIVEPPHAPLGDTINAVGTGAAGVFLIGQAGVGPVVYRWSGTMLTIVPGLDVATRSLPSSFYPTGVAVTDTVWAIGEWFDEGAHTQSHVAAYRWDGGTTWTATPMPSLVSGPTSYALARGASAVGGTPMVVGEYADYDAYALRPMILRWDGASWNLEPTTASKQVLRSIVDDGVGGGWAVGLRWDGKYGSTTVGGDPALALHWDGRTWTDYSPAAADNIPGFDAVAARDPMHAFGVGGKSGASFLPRGSC
jgi:hypothetical protein